MMVKAGQGAIAPPQKRGNLDGYHPGKAPKSTSYRANYSQHKNKNQQLGFADVRMAAAGRWESIHRALGVNIPQTKKHTACPGCGGKDRFRLDVDYDQSGRWVCGGGGDFQQGDGFALLSHVYGWTLADSLRAVADHLGLSKMPDRDRAALRLQADRLAAQMAADAKRKDEQSRRDSNLIVMLEDMIDAIKYRQYLQCQVNGINGRVTWEPSPDEIQTAQDLNYAILDAYAKGDDHV